MEKLSILFVFLMAILFQEAQSTEDFLWGRIRIDCGASKESMPYEAWQLDGEYIKTGQNKNVSTDITPQEMRTLRSFPDGNKNCYKFALYSQRKYLLRAGFYYGNYDGLSKPPVFDLTINGQYWTRIYSNLSTDGVQYVEVIYQTKKSRHELCLVRLGDDVPFISSIQAAELFDDDLYRLMTNDTILYLQSRMCFGGEGDVGQKSNITNADRFDRIWKLQKMPGYENVTSFSDSFGNSDEENQPPRLVLANAITPKNNSNPNNTISMWIPIPLSPSPAAYFVLYFNEPTQYPTITHIRRIKIYIDGREMGIAEVPQNYTSQVVSFYPVAINGPAVNVTLVEAEGSTFPPILNAMEVFSSKEVSNGGYSHYCASMILAVFHIFGILMLIG